MLSLNKFETDNVQVLTARSQYAVISFLRGVCLFILNCTTALSCPSTLRLICSASLDCKQGKHDKYNKKEITKMLCHYGQKCKINVYLFFITHFTKICSKNFLTITICYVQSQRSRERKLRITITSLQTPQLTAVK